MALFIFCRVLNHLFGGGSYFDLEVRLGRLRSGFPWMNLIYRSSNKVELFPPFHSKTSLSLSIEKQSLRTNDTKPSKNLGSIVFIQLVFDSISPTVGLF